jgi:putative hemolysin
MDTSTASQVSSAIPMVVSSSWGGMVWIEIGVVALLIFVNGLLAMAEIAIISARKTRLQAMAADGSEDAKVALRLASEPTEFLAAIQVGITLIGVIAGAFGGATIAERLAVHLREIAPLNGYEEELAFGIVVVLIAVASLIMGELVPKRLGMVRAESLAALVARPMSFVAFVMRPAVRVLSWVTNIVLRLFRVRATGDTELTEEELKIMIEQGTASGLFGKAGENIMKRALRLGDRTVEDLMTPRPKVVALDLADPQEKSIRAMLESPHSYFPAYDGTPDRILGLIAIKDMWAKLVKGGKVDLRSSLVQPLYAVSSMPALRLLELFKQSGKHVAIAVDEHGGTAGIITIIDLMEAIVGDLPDSKDEMRASAIKRKDGSWLVDGMIASEDLKEILHLTKLPREDDGDYQSLGGMVMAVLGRIPRETDTFVWDNWRFEVVDMDGLRVDKVMVLPVRQSPKERKH